MEIKKWDDCDIEGPCTCYPYAGTSEYIREGDELVYCRSLEWEAMANAPELDARQKIWLGIDPNIPDEDIDMDEVWVKFYNPQPIEDF